MLRGFGVILLAPLAKGERLHGHFVATYTALFSYACHQIGSERSFHVEGEQFAVCSRCFGVYFGLLAGFLVYPLWRPIDEIEPNLPRFWLFLSLVPITIDWSLGIFGIWENTLLSRFTPDHMGVACATFIVPALIEIFRNFSFTRQIKKAA